MSSTVPDAEHWNARYRSVDSVWPLDPNQFVVEYLSDLPAGSMLDLGGGEGRNALWFASRGWSVENSDFSDVAIDKFLTRAAQNELVDRCVGTVASALTPEACVTAPVDLVVIAYLQLVAGDLAKAIEVAANSLAVGGELFGVWHDRSHIGRHLGGPQDPAFTPTVSELRSHAERAGLTVHVCEIRERRATRDGVTGTAIDVVLRASR